VPSITLFVFGGVSSLADEPKQARQEFAISIVGPLTSFGLAVVFGAIWFFLRDEGVGMVPGYLAGVNLLLGVFNLLPGFPLDGGRVLRSIVWGRTKSFVRATRVASNAGTGIAWILIVLGLVNVFAFGLLGGLWYVFVGLFLKSAAQGSYQAVVVERTLGRILAEQVMQPPPDPIEGEMTIQRLVDERVLAGRGRCYFIGREGAIVGLITSTDVAGVPREEWGVRTVSSAMVPAARVITIDPKANLIDALKLMQQHDIHQLPVLERGQLVGVLTRGDIMRQIELRQEFAAAEP
jgi:CBS domain-containing protein